MTETALTALIGVGGTILVTIISLVIQHLNTKTIISLQEKSKIREKRIDRIISAISDLLVTSDPQSANGVDYGKTINSIIIVQLLLDVDNKFEKELNVSLNDLGYKLQEYYFVQTRPIEDKINETKNLLTAHSQVIEKTRALLKHYNKSSVV
jgi:hypothetical protein